MADNQLIIPILNPVFFYKKARTILPQYHTKFREDFPSVETRRPWQSTPLGCYFQKWQTNDTIRLQVMSNVAPIYLVIYDCKGNRAAAPLQFTQKQRNRFIPDLFIYEANYNPAGLARGRYRLEIQLGDPILTAETLESDWLDIADDWPNTVLIEYTSSLYYGDAIFATDWAPSFRVEGWFKMRPPGSVNTVYVDQVQNQRLLFSDPFLTEEFIIGPASGVPDWTPELLIWVLGCDEVFIDGKQFTKASESANFSQEEIDGYQYSGWSIDLRYTNRRSSRIFPIDPSLGGKKLLVALNVETQGFADTTVGSSSNVIPITVVE